MAGSEWQEFEGKLVKLFNFDTFVEALAFVNRVGELAEDIGHHPDITFGWGYAEISLFTHDEAKITQKDTDLAKQIDGLIG